MGVLVAISIPIFTTQLEKAREATDLANIRSAYAELTAAYLDDSTKNHTEVKYTQQTAGWQTKSASVGGADLTATGAIAPTKNGTATIDIVTSGTKDNQKVVVKINNVEVPENATSNKTENDTTSNS